MLSSHKPGSTLTSDQKNDFRTAFMRDLRERATPEAWQRMEEKLITGVTEKESNLRSCHIGTQLAIAIIEYYKKSTVTVMNLHDNLIMDLGAEAIGGGFLREAGSPSLLTLDVGSNDIGPAGIHTMAQGVDSHRRLNTLILGSDTSTRTVNRCDAPTAKLLFEKCVNCRSLRTLHLNHIDIGSHDGGQEALAAAVPLIVGGGMAVAALNHLHLGHTRMSTATAVKIIEAVKSGGSLVTLDLHGNNLGPAAAEAMGQVLMEKSKRTTVSNLKVLLFHQNPKLKPAPIFTGLAKDRGVTTLNVSKCEVDDESLATLCATLATNNVLTDIDISHGQITEVGAVELARGLVRHPCIKRVVLSGNRIKDDGACAMAAVIEHARHSGAPSSSSSSSSSSSATAASGGGDGGNKSASSPTKSSPDAAAVAAAAGGAVGLEELHLDECWISDRGAVALGVSIASNTSLRMLRMNNNHVSGQAGTALAALLEKNQTMLTCTVVGNTLSHSTASAIERVIDRNRAIKADEDPKEKRKQRSHLHFKLYKLEEAKAELATQQKLRDKHAKSVESLENQITSENMEYKKKKKELNDAQRDAEISCQAAEQAIRSMADAFDKFVIDNRADVEAQQDKLKQEQEERAKAEKELERIQKEVAESVHLRQRRLDDLQSKIAEAQRDQMLWVEQTALYKEQLDEAQAQRAELEAAGNISSRSRRTNDSHGRSARSNQAGRSTRGRGRTNSAAASQQNDAAASFLEGLERGDAN